MLVPRSKVQAHHEHNGGITMKKVIGPALLADEGIFDKVIDFINKINSSVTYVGLAIAVTAAIFLGIGLMTGGTQSFAKNKPWALAIVIGVAVICLAPALVQAISSAIS